MNMKQRINYLLQKYDEKNQQPVYMALTIKQTFVDEFEQLAFA